MNKPQIIEQMVLETGLSRADTEKALNAIFKVGATTLKKGERVVISKVATFSVKTRAARTGRNPQTGKPITIKPKKVIVFKPNCPPPH